MENNKIYLVDYSKEYLDKSWFWLNDAEIKHLTSSPDITKDDQINFYNSLPNRNDYIIKGIELNGKPIGACGLKKIKNEEAEYWGYIVEKDCWGKGYGKAIIDFMIEIGKQKSLTSLYLNVIKANIRALGLYSKMGFVIEHEDENNIKMRLSL